MERRYTATLVPTCSEADTGLYDWNDSNGPAADLKPEIASIDIEGSIATVRLELDNWTGHKFTDMFTLLKTDGEWKIISKVFYLHPEGE